MIKVVSIILICCMVLGVGFSFTNFTDAYSKWTVRVRDAFNSISGKTGIEGWDVALNNPIIVDRVFNVPSIDFSMNLREIIYNCLLKNKRSLDITGGELEYIANFDNFQIDDILAINPNVYKVQYGNNIDGYKWGVAIGMTINAKREPTIVEWLSGKRLIDTTVSVLYVSPEFNFELPFNEDLDIYENPNSSYFYLDLREVNNSEGVAYLKSDFFTNLYIYRADGRYMPLYDLYNCDYDNNLFLNGDNIPDILSVNVMNDLTLNDYILTSVIPIQFVEV